VEPVGRDLLVADPLEVAPRLLGLVVVHGGRAGRVVEVEAYRGTEDPASHASRGRTPRNATMFGRAGLLYVYFSYGTHWCANVVCGEEGVAGAVLLRALEPVAGVEAMRAPRGARRHDGRPPPDADLCRGPGNLTRALEPVAGVEAMRAPRGARRHDGRPPPDADLCRGPGNLTRALGIGPEHDGVDLLGPGAEGPRLVAGRAWPVAPAEVARGPRVGISRATEADWRFWVAASQSVSGRRRHR
jgi:DNA-3-methyladenine glycosylase